MSKPLTFKRKVQLFFMYLKQQKDGVIVNCPFCKSTNIKFEHQLEHHIDDKIVYTSEYKCNDCKATCKNQQDWFNKD